MSVPDATPDAWFHRCSGSNVSSKGSVEPHAWTDDARSHWCCPHGCVSFQSPESSAIWGSQWALVAWLAENETRQGVLWEYLDGLRNAGGALCVEDELDTLPEDAMQLLTVNL